MHVHSTRIHVDIKGFWAKIHPDTGSVNRAISIGSDLGCKCDDALSGWATNDTANSVRLGATVNSKGGDTQSDLTSKTGTFFGGDF